jgi:hypothetical protein
MTFAPSLRELLRDGVADAARGSRHQGDPVL